MLACMHAEPEDAPKFLCIRISMIATQRYKPRTRQAARSRPNPMIQLQVTTCASTFSKPNCAARATM